ncbi:MAG TPA: hypothetical protein VF405_15175 [Gammaproteobacteria bacterium]
MKVWSDLRRAIRQAILVQKRVDRLIIDVEKTTDRLLDHDRRLTHIETLIARARRRQLPSS